MIILGIVFCLIFILIFLFGNIKIDGEKDITIGQRLLACLYISVIFIGILGLPILGIVYLLSTIVRII